MSRASSTWKSTLLPAFLARNLWRCWRVVEKAVVGPPRASTPADDADLVTVYEWKDNGIVTRAFARAGDFWRPDEMHGEVHPQHVVWQIAAGGESKFYDPELFNQSFRSPPHVGRFAERELNPPN